MEKNNEFKISVFFPAYNDEKTIPGLVNDAISMLKPLTNDYEIIIVDDGGPDNVGQIADEMAKKDPHIKVVHHKVNRGYGGALKSGFKASTKDYIFYTDGDGQYDVKEIIELLKYKDNYDVVNGYKIGRGDGLHRVLLGKAYNMIARWIYWLRIRDVDCDFRLFKREVIDNLKLNSNDGFICVEMMYKISRKDYKIKELPVHHYPRKYGVSQFFSLKGVTKTLSSFTVGWWNLVIRKKLK